jgi:hypothetical protein
MHHHECIMGDLQGGQKIQTKSSFWVFENHGQWARHTETARNVSGRGVCRLVQTEVTDMNYSKVERRLDDQVCLGEHNSSRYCSHVPGAADKKPHIYF